MVRITLARRKHAALPKLRSRRRGRVQGTLGRKWTKRSFRLVRPLNRHRANSAGSQTRCTKTGRRQRASTRSSIGRARLLPSSAKASFCCDNLLSSPIPGICSPFSIPYLVPHHADAKMAAKNDDIVYVIISRVVVSKDHCISRSLVP